jgi:hypothetical protein
MAKDTGQEIRLEDLSADEIERIEGMLFCLGGPPEHLTQRLLARAGEPRPAARKAA